jgi:hypothetical protein
MRTWGRINQVNGLGGTWVEVTTDSNGYNDGVYLTTLVQVLKLNLGESPFYANYGIPAAPSVITQIQPDYYAAMTQKQFAPYFASLQIFKATVQANPVKPTYNITLITQNGSTVSGPVAT